MMTNRITRIAAILMLGAGLLPMAAQAAEDNATLALKAMVGLFVDHDPSVVDTYWAPDYIQHNPGVGNGSAGIKAFAGMFPPNFKYEPGLVVASGDLVMIHGRYSGFGPKPMVGVDIFRMKNGKFVEHWDVLQEEVPAAQTKSGNPMFAPDEK